MKIIFLDVDGVLNTQSNIAIEKKNGHSTSSFHIILDKTCLENLKILVDNTDAKLVISSSWRIGGDSNPAMRNLSNQLAEYNLQIFGTTRVLELQRGDEIRDWLSNYSNIESFVILDDDSDMCEYTNTNLVLCSFSTGLTTKEVEMSINILNKK